jgi:plastocyanin
MKLTIAFITSLLAATSAFAKVHTVRVGTDGRDVYTPKELTIDVGDTVSWVLVSGTHDVVESDGPGSCEPKSRGFNSGVFTTRVRTWNHTFTSAGTIHYMCSVGSHCADGMVGTIIVGGPRTNTNTNRTENQDNDNNNNDNNSTNTAEAADEGSNTAMTLGSSLANTLFVISAAVSTVMLL